MRVVVDLVRDDDVSRRKLLLQRAAGTDADNALYAQRLQGVNIGTVGDFAWRDVMANSVPCQEGNALSLQCADDDRCAGFSKGGGDSAFLRIAQSRHGI